MKSFEGKFAVVTGGGTGMGRELARQLAAEGCNVAMCDVSAKSMAETVALIEADRPPQGTKVSSHVADVSDEAQLIRFRGEAAERHQTDKLNLLFNNAGIGGGGSFVNDSRQEWEKTFNVCWGGVYLGCRTFLPMMLEADEGHIVNTASVNGFWASLGPRVSHTAYAAAKFAVKGFTEALVTDLRLNAPHIKCSVVMPGHIGTSIVANSRKVISGRDEDQLSAEDIARARARIARAMGEAAAQLSDEQISAMAAEQARRFLEDAPTSAAEAAKIILDGVRAERWRILVGKDAHAMDLLVREDPEHAYEPEFFERLIAATGWRLGG
ncbi:MAG TPA: SDR family NAD(P)-dependent oxidoreductase [Phenylobacterium sp.]|uniref:SDR family NAD(P)-dependent oxidoreductase n=1 Tax=Phenylobacterium sp. TaxID=1871053 RepID=UPI002BCC090F|nr:SDR family NAD(P)-dependent oxidoreductase [Phenylobacterium sp.]HSV02795.1 SDR family NAD(P)-dependent oxidoreductase [Phenylobacterium sp.]